MCLNLEKYEEFVKVQAIYDKCKKCSNFDYLIPYNFKEDWICNSCILDIKNNYNNQFIILSLSPLSSLSSLSSK